MSDEVKKDAAHNGSIPPVASDISLAYSDEDSKRKFDVLLSSGSNDSPQQISSPPVLPPSAENQKSISTSVHTEAQAPTLPPKSVPSNSATTTSEHASVLGTLKRQDPTGSTDKSVSSEQDSRVSTGDNASKIADTKNPDYRDDSPPTSFRTNLKASVERADIGSGDEQTKNLKKSVHQRMVSWSDQQGTSGEIPSLVLPPRPTGRSPPLAPTSINRKYFPESPGSASYSTSSIEDDIPTKQPQLNRSSTTNSKISVRLSDVIRMNPLESEAETLILRALDKEDAINVDRNDGIDSNGNRSRANTGNSLLGNVPDEAATVFSPEPTRPRANTVRSSTVPAPRPQTTKKAVHHQRTNTMEETLAELTEALNALDTQPQAKDVESRVASAGETLAKNANRLFLVKQKSQRMMNYDASQEDNSNVPDRVTTPGKNWALLRNVVRATSRINIDQDNIPPPSNRAGSLHSHKKTSSDDIQKDAEEGLSIMSGDVSVISNSAHGNNSNNNDSNPKLAFDDVSDKKVNQNEKKKFLRNKKNILVTTGAQTKGAVRDFQMFVGARRTSFRTYLISLLLLVIPASGVACILFYLSGNPPTGRVDQAQSGSDLLVNHRGEFIDPTQPSASWWIIFICIRQALTFSLARIMQTFIIDFLCLGSRACVNMFGNLFTLLIVQSKGWPFIVLMWGILDFGLLHGGSRFAGHWCYWQEFADIFNDNNPSGDVTSNIWNTRILSIAVCVGAVVAFKRLWLGLYLGKNTYSNFAEDLSKVVKKMLILCEVAAFARECLLDSFVEDDSSRAPSVSEYGMSRKEFEGLVQSGVDNDEESIYSRRSLDGKNVNSSYHGGNLVDDSNNDGSISQSQRSRIFELLGDWEDPEDDRIAEENISISSILQFRQSLSFLESRFMFSLAWGDVGSREKMVVSSQEVYRRLMLKSRDKSVLRFDVLALAAKRNDGSLDQKRLKEIIRLMRPDRDGNLSLLDFVKSVDAVYKEAKLLRASVENSEKIDRALEKIINVAFYTIMTCIILSQLGLDPLALFLSLSSLIVGFAFMIGSASSKMFEGFLFILIRRPYGIGDRIHISNPESDTNPNGSSGWIVKDVTLFHTIAVFATTGEKATLSNGSLASSRVINMARSPNGVIYIYLKFSVNVSYERVQVFEQAVRDFVKARPREWANFLGFRATAVMADLGYIEYVVVLQHRESWQSTVSILTSKADVSSFCLELSKKLDMRYQSPPLPVDLALSKRDAQSVQDVNSIISTLGGLHDSEEGSAFGDIAVLFDKKIS